MSQIITIEGRPVPYVRTTQKQKYTDKNYHKYYNFKKLIQWNATKIDFFGDTKVKVYVDVYLYGGGKLNMGNDGDIDNYIKSALDSLNKVAYTDDRYVISVVGTKYSVESKAEEKMVIIIQEYQGVK